MRLPFQRPRPPLLSEVEPYYRLSEAKRYYSNGGPCARLLAERLRDLLGDVTVVPVANATIGLEVALTACLRERGPLRVVMPSFTFPATALAATRLGHRPVFVDIDPRTWQIANAQVERALAESDEPVAVVGCTTFGTPPTDEALLQLEEICATRDVPLMVDAAAALAGTTSSGSWYGAGAELSVFSMHVTKTAATCEAGFIVAREPMRAEAIHRLINFGFDADHRAVDRDATNGKLSEIAAAFALAALDRLDDAVARRRELVQRAITEFPSELQWQSGVERSTLQFISVSLPAHKARAAVVASLANRGVETRFNFVPLNVQPAFADDFVVGDLQVTTSLGDRILSLPMYTDMTDEEMTWLIESVRLAFDA